MDELDWIKKLAGINEPIAGSTALHPASKLTGNDKARIMKEHNIKPGTDAWFQLWFAKTEITGEQPFVENSNENK